MAQALEKSLEVVATMGDERIGPGRVSVREFSANQKMGNALKRLVLFWLAAVVCVFIPVLHFILVPLFLILGVTTFLKTIKVDGKIIKGQVDCPYCKNQMKLKPGLLAWPLKEICQTCGRAIRINPK